ncbi:MAG: YbaB/EbfC family nucleoid-associated protein [Limnochordia bacterium]|jgi:DNA-binding YbaB/EbfC family protein|nr:YbaB/EbfC family nucleoid-associated protein [Limnochordia bacterium]MDD2629038.1 YbaB/EbfC family nucleoid-associated protein [Limnochordia bacterium]MDD4518400.1 YbaB/EbfC family nucleoid-associated protein [Limnochordia bacterium]
MSQMRKMMKEVKKMQDQMLKLQEEVAQKTVEATAGGGVVKVVANGNLEIVGIEIAKDIIDPEDADMLQDLVMAAVNEAIRSAQEMSSQAMQAVTGGMNIPGLEGMF